MTKAPRLSSETPDAEDPDLAVSLEKLSYLVLKAREFDVKDVVTDPDPASNPSDDSDIAILEDHPDDPVAEELFSFIQALSEDEQIDLVALVWLGRGDEEAADWPSIRAEAARVHNNRTAQYLLGVPLLADFIEEGLEKLGLSIDEVE